jgi:drug/metabolite transporter (DMT)-like permease
LKPAVVLKKFHALPDNARGAIILMLAAFGFTIMTVLIKYLGARLHVTQILFLRQVGMTLMVMPTLIRGFPGSIRSTRPGLQVARIGLALIAMTTGFTAIIHMPLADATAIGFAKSFFVTLFAILILHETVRIRRWSATIIGFLGVLLMLQPGTAGFSIYGLYAVIAAAAAGCVMVIIRLLSRNDAAVTILTYQAVGVGIAMALPAIIYWQPPTAFEWILIVAIGIVSYFAQKCNIYAYKWGEASLLASLDYVRLIYATLLGFLVFGDLPGVYTWVGAAIIVAASIYIVHREAQLRKRMTK